MLKIEKPDQQTKRRRSTFEKAPTPDLKTPKVKETPVEQKQSTTRKKSPRSPGVKEMLGAMKSEMSDKEMKESLLSVLDKNVQDKCMYSFLACLFLKKILRYFALTLHLGERVFTFWTVSIIIEDTEDIYY